VLGAYLRGSLAGHHSCHEGYLVCAGVARAAPCELLASYRSGGGELHYGVRRRAAREEAGKIALGSWRKIWRRVSPVDVAQYARHAFILVRKASRAPWRLPHPFFPTPPALPAACGADIAPCWRHQEGGDALAALPRAHAARAACAVSNMAGQARAAPLFCGKYLWNGAAA